ncbi:hypothetical protein [Crocosphaera sp.]|uniref:hypothetical protein n=1 Tax=Crocosphaera sp. TaxID=2729996 RepID=UPI002603754F|nr:hypothetical protein [Crocosphaera sp.]MDJ0579081.1 hypothetical protein [Crocosphaera sp.]
MSNSKDALRDQILSELLALDNESSLATSSDLKQLTVSLRTQLEGDTTIEQLQSIFDSVIKIRRKIVQASIKNKLDLWAKAQTLFKD